MVRAQRLLAWLIFVDHAGNMVTSGQGATRLWMAFRTASLSNGRQIFGCAPNARQANFVRKCRRPRAANIIIQYPPVPRRNQWLPFPILAYPRNNRHAGNGFVTRADRLRLEAIVADRSAPQKHVWRAQGY